MVTDNGLKAPKAPQDVTRDDSSNGAKKGDARRRGQRFNPGKRSRCRFCQEKVTRVDYKDVQNLQNLVSAQGKIVSRRRSGNCARHQRMVQRAIKQARYICLLSFTEGQMRGGRMPGRSW